MTAILSGLMSVRPDEPLGHGRDVRVGPLCVHAGDGLWWARLGDRGPGLLLKDTARRRLLFSEREGHSGVRVGRWLVKLVWWEVKRR